MSWAAAEAQESAANTIQKHTVENRELIRKVPMSILPADDAEASATYSFHMY